MSELKHPDEWANEQGIIIYDADGWSNNLRFGLCKRDYNDPITEEEFNARMILSTIMPLPKEED